MARFNEIVLLGLLLFASPAVFAQPLRTAYSTQEPPMAEPGETKPAPAETTVIPGQPQRLDVNSLGGGATWEISGQEENPTPLPFGPMRSGTGDANEIKKMMNEPSTSRQTPEKSTGIEQTQYVVPAPGPAPVVHPEPPTPAVRISVKGVDTAPTGQELAYRLVVTNISQARAHNVIARCPLPRGAKFIKALPQPSAEGKDLEWHLETLEAGASRTIEVVFKPNDDVVEIAVVGKVQFEHGRVIKTRIANPKLDLKKTGPAQGIVNDPMTYRIVVTNPSVVPVTDISIVDTLPDGLEYVRETLNGAVPVSKVGPAPNQRTWTLGTLKPNETRTLDYRVIPRKVGEWTSEATATATGITTKAGWNTAIQEAKLTLQVTGPANEKAAANQATPYQIFVHNTGSATLHNVRISCSFPTELRVSKASTGGHLYKDAVQWVLPKLEPKETKELTISLTAPSAGLRDIIVAARADLGLEQRKKLPTSFEGVPALNWQAEGTPVAAPGQEIVYTITVKNPGSAPAKNVKIVADLSELVELRQAQPAFQRGQGTVFFNAIDIPAKETVTFKLTVVAKKAGEARFQFEMTAEGMSSGPLKNTRATTISPGSAPKNNPIPDPTRIGVLPPLEEMKPETKTVVPAEFISPVVPSSPPGPGTDR